MQYPVELNVQYAEKLSRLTTFFRFIMIVPQVFVLYFVSIAVGVIVFLSWFAVWITGRYPKSFFDFVVWYLRWSTRVNVYSYFLTDKYPPFSGDPSTIAPTAAPQPKP